MLINFFKKEERLTDAQQLSIWELNGKPTPPPHIVKQQVLSFYKKQYEVEVLVETGTFLGDMVAAMIPHFNKIYSVELSSRLYHRAIKRFRSEPKVHLKQGDSGKVLHQIVSELYQPALFWLDGHYSGGITALADKECPVPEELAIILKSPYQHIVLIDDARLFNGTNSYPTIEELRHILDAADKLYSLVIENDIIRLTPIQ